MVGFNEKLLLFVIFGSTLVVATVMYLSIVGSDRINRGDYQGAFNLFQPIPYITGVIAGLTLVLFLVASNWEGLVIGIEKMRLHSTFENKMVKVNINGRPVEMSAVDAISKKLITPEEAKLAIKNPEEYNKEFEARLRKFENRNDNQNRGNENQNRGNDNRPRLQVITWREFSNNNRSIDWLKSEIKKRINYDISKEDLEFLVDISRKMGGNIQGDKDAFDSLSKILTSNAERSKFADIFRKLSKVNNADYVLFSRSEKSIFWPQKSAMFEDNKNEANGVGKIFS